MKKLVATACAGVLGVITAHAAFDGTLSLSAGPYQNSSGGEFTATATGLGTFQTFCLEFSEGFNFGGTYDFRKNTGAVVGGGNTASPIPTDPTTGLTMDNISIGTAYLYSQFRAGTLTDNLGHNYFTFGNRKDNAGLLQNAFWMLEDEIGPGSPLYNLNNPYLLKAESALGGSSLSDIHGDSNGAYDVVALNLFNGPNYQDVQNPAGVHFHINQDQLGIIPEPSTVIAGALLVLPFGASVVRIVRRKVA